MKRVAIIGTQGVPAAYGGFETLVENIIGENCAPDVHYTVFCSGKDCKQRLDTYKGARLEYVPLHANGMQSIPYDMLSMCRSLRGYDVLLVLGVSGCMFLPVVRLLSRAKVIVNLDGLEHKRKKWGTFARRVLRLSEAVAVRFAHVIVADNKGIQDYVTGTYGKQAELIAYGGDHVLLHETKEHEQAILDRYGLSSQEYAMSVCRIEPENNCHVILEAFARTDKKLIFIGNWEKGEYGKELKEKYANSPNIRILDPIYDLDILYAFRKHAGWYMHGHSAGGTNPSLVEAMFFGRPILCYDVVYNRETTFGQAYYWKDAASLVRLLSQPNLDGSAMTRLARQHYTWKVIAGQYERLYGDN